MQEPISLCPRLIGITAYRVHVQWDSAARIIGLGWTLHETLVVMTQDGTYRLYPLATAASASSAPLYTQHSLEGDAATIGVLEVQIHARGMVVLLEDWSFVEVRGWESSSLKESEVQCIKLALGGFKEAPHCWEVIPAEQSTSGSVEVLVSVGSTIIRLDELDAVDQVRAIAWCA